MAQRPLWSSASLVSLFPHSATGLARAGTECFLDGLPRGRDQKIARAVTPRSRLWIKVKGQARLGEHLDFAPKDTIIAREAILATSDRGTPRSRGGCLPKNLRSFLSFVLTAAAVLSSSASGTSVAHAGIRASSTFPGRDGKIVFLRAVVRGDTASEVGLMTVNRNGTGLRMLHLGLKHPTLPAWSPNGKWLAVEGRGGGETAYIYVVRPNGRGLRRLTARHKASETPRWSPDGKRLVFNVWEVSGRPRRVVPWIYTIGVDGRHLRKLLVGIEPVWSPDGRHIAFKSMLPNTRTREKCPPGTATQSLCVAKANGTGVRVIATNLENGVDGLDWSPNSRSLVYVGVDADGSDQLYAASANGGGTRLIWRTNHVFPSPDRFGDPRFAPDGRKIVMSVLENWTPIYGANEIAVVNVDGSGLHYLTQNRPRNDNSLFEDGYPDWQPVRSG
jgi:Tol biopolymer transport system component